MVIPAERPLERIHRDVMLFHPQIVIIFFGSNDSAMLEDYYRPLIEYEKNLRSITELVLSFNMEKNLITEQLCLFLLLRPLLLIRIFFHSRPPTEVNFMLSPQKKSH